MKKSRLKGDCLLIDIYTYISSVITDRKIALLSSVGTLVSSIGVFLTVREMEKQRKNAQKPEIIIDAPYFFCKARGIWKSRDMGT
jgi:hypothetical protein